MRNPWGKGFENQPVSWRKPSGKSQARQHGLYTTARTLHVDYGSLKKRREAAGARRVPAPAFIELPAAPPTGLGPCVIDLHVPRGRRMRIEVPGVTRADLVALTQVAWGRPR